MKLSRFGPAGNPKPGVILADGTRIDVSRFGSDYDEAFLARQGFMELDRWENPNNT